MTYRLYGENGSGAGIVELALAEVGVAYEWVNVSLGGEEQRAAPYTSLNPQRKLPTLITPSGEVLTEAPPACTWRCSVVGRWMRPGAPSTCRRSS